MERRFQCTACGKCCFGWLPLTLEDAIGWAGRSPLAVVWTPVKPASKAYELTAKFGITVRSRDKKSLAVRIVPTSYIPPSLPCPELGSDNLCQIQTNKPSRCRTMPFFPYREESDQADLLVPRAGWLCDVSAAAPVVYRDKAILEHEDFDRERSEIIKQTPILRAYGEWVLKTAPAMLDDLAKAAMKPGGGHVVVSFASLLRRLSDVDKISIAQAQLAMLAKYKEKIAGNPAMAEYQRNYGDWAWEMERLA
jgi:Fe-S-cluster containining protein